MAHYEVISLLGRGGMGEVYKARDTRLERIVALKLIRSDRTDDPSFRQRFLREARAASSLNHPGILTIFDIGTDKGTDYIAMEHVGGGTLADLLIDGPLPLQRALDLAAQVAEALGAAHAAGLVHRDLKPSNIMLTEGGRAKVVDFGLAKTVDTLGTGTATVEQLTVPGEILGTTSYMSPEQITGQPLDARSDLFSLGAILYEMLSGRRPFEGETVPETLAAILRDQPSRIDGLCPEVAGLVERCLKKEPDQRFQSACRLATAIQSDRLSAFGTERPSVAVLPFVNMSGEKQDDYLCEGLSEEIISALTRIPGLRVIARTSAFAAGRLGLDVREIGARLAVDNILDGSVRRAGRRVRVSAQLVNTADGSHLWSERYDRQLDDVLLLEDEIAEAISERLRGDLIRGGAREPRAAVDPEAHQAYLEGRYHFARMTPESLARAKACYERALAEDPNSALAYDSLAELYWYLGFYGSMLPREAFTQSTWHALRALELDDTLAEAHALLGMLRKELDYNWPEVDRELGRALELSPGSPLVRLRHAISGLLPRARIKEAIAEIEFVLKADPLSIFVRWWLGIMLSLDRAFEPMIAEGHHMITLEPALFHGHWVLGMGLDGVGDHPGAAAALERAHQLSGGNPFTLGFMAYARGRAGDPEGVRALLDEARRKPGYVPPSIFMLGEAGLENWDEVFPWIEAAIEARDPIIMPIKTFAFLDPIRDDPRYLVALQKMNLTAD